MNKQFAWGTVVGALLAPLTSAQSTALDQQTERPTEDTPAQPTLATLPPIDVSEDIHDRIWYDRPEEGVLWARGRTYKASFDADSAAYVPFLGSDAPRNYPVDMRLERVSVGGTTVEHSAETSPVRDGDRVTMERGILTEIYQLDLESIEQLFEIPALIGFGELVVRLAVETELEPSPEGGGLRFHGRHGDVLYGAATVLDAVGASVQAPVDWEDGAILIRVPEAFVASATYPIVIDPVVSTFTIGALSGADLQAPDAAYDAGLHTYLVVFKESFSHFDSDVFCKLVFNNGGWVDQGYVDQTTDDWDEAEVANLRDANKFICVASVDQVGETHRNIRSRTRATSSPTWTAAYTLNSITDRHAVSPDVGGGDIGAWRVVWEEVVQTGVDANIRSRRVLSGGQPSSTLNIANTVGHYDHDPMIADDLDGTSVELPIVWTHRAGSVREIRGATVGNFSFVLNPFTIAGGPTGKGAPSCSPIADGVGDGVWLVAYHQDFGDIDIMCSALRGSTVIDNIDLSTTEGNFLPDQAFPRVATDGERFVVAYQHFVDSQNADPYLATVNLVGSQLMVPEGRVELSSSLNSDESVMVTSEYQGGGSANRFLALWSEDGGDYEIKGARYDAPENLGLGTNYCDPVIPNSSGLQARISAYGSLFPGAVLTLAASGLPADQFGYFLTSRTAGFIETPGSSSGNFCLGSPTGRFNSGGQIANSGPNGMFELGIDTSFMPMTPEVSVLSGETWRFQAWFRDGGTSNFTDGLAITFE